MEEAEELPSWSVAVKDDINNDHVTDTHHRVISSLVWEAPQVEEMTRMQRIRRFVLLE
jgi:hypothetical protein